MWRYYAQRATSGEWLHRDLPLSNVTVSPALSGPYKLSATIDPEYADLYAEDGDLLLAEWGTWVFAEASNQLRGGGLITDATITGSKLDLTIDGFTRYPSGQPLTETLTWGGKTEGATGAGVDALDVVRALWDHLQAQPDGDLGVTYTSTSTPYRVGEWHNARALDADGSLGDDPKAVHSTPIPIDKIWNPKKDRPPIPASGKTVYWKYQLPWWEGIEVGRQIDELARQAGFDYRESYRWADSSKESVVLELQFGYPRLGRRQSGLVFREGENITDLVPIARSGNSYYNAVYGLGAGEGSKKLRQSVSRRDPTRLRRAKPLDRAEITNAAALKAEAGDELRRSVELVDITGFTIRDHPNARVGSFDVGDDVLVHTRRGWQPTSLWVRITGFTHSPDTGDVTVRCSRSDRFAYGGS